MFDLAKTIDLIKGGLLEPRATWDKYLAENRDWKETAVLLTVPLVIVSVLVSGILSWIFRSYNIFGHGIGLGGMLLGIIAGLLSVAVTAFLFSFFANTFKGVHDFNKGLAAMSLAMIPSYVGQMLSAVPLIGWLVSLGLGVLSLVFLYKIIPSYLKVPDDKRVVHFIVSLIAAIIVVLVIGSVIGISTISQRPHGMHLGDHDDSQQTAGKYSMLGSLGRQAELMESAENDQYAPPADGRISVDQVQRYLDVAAKVAALRQEQAQRLQQLEQEYKGKEPGIADIGKLASGMGTVLGTANAELEVVKTAGGNWAEHEWVKSQLRVARIQKDLNVAVKHNYALLQQHQADFDRLGIVP